MKIDNYIQELKLKLDKIIKRFNAEQKQIFAQIPVNITKLAISFGLNVYEFNDNKLESYIFNDNIGVNSELSYLEKRFAIARELSCYLLNKQLKQKNINHITYIENKKNIGNEIFDYSAHYILVLKNQLVKINLNEIAKEAKRFEISSKNLLKRIKAS